MFCDRDRILPVHFASVIGGENAPLSPNSPVQITFKTKQDRFRIPEIPVSVPINITLYDLIILMNSMIKEINAKHRSTRFDFCINNELLRSTLREHLLIHGSYNERNIEVEYFEPSAAPSHSLALVHDDWVSAVSIGKQWIISGTYDYALHLWETGGKHIIKIPGHKGVIKDVAWVESNSPLACHFISVCQDSSVILWEWNIGCNKILANYVYRGHKQSVECVSVKNSDFEGFMPDIFATGGFDHNVNLWSTDPDKCGKINKKPRLDKVYNRTMFLCPIKTLNRHSGNVSALQWIKDGNLLTASWDRSVKIWDVDSGQVKTEMIQKTPIFGAHYSDLNNLLLTTSNNRFVNMCDMRVKDGFVKDFTHKHQVLTVKWSPTIPYLFLTGTMDPYFRLWDYRSPDVPLYQLRSHDNSILCCDWDSRDIIVSGGSDNLLHLYKRPAVLPPYNLTHTACVAGFVSDTSSEDEVEEDEDKVEEDEDEAEEYENEVEEDEDKTEEECTDEETEEETEESTSSSNEEACDIDFSNINGESEVQSSGNAAFPLKDNGKGQNEKYQHERREPLVKENPQINMQGNNSDKNQYLEDLENPPSSPNEEIDNGDMVIPESLLRYLGF